MDRPYVVSGRVKFGQMVGTAPVYEKFYGGGMGSIRGFEYRGISPRGTNANGTSNDGEIGGDMSFFAGVEYNMPIYKESHRGVVFLDTGTVESDFEITTYRISFGVGLRVTIPMFGPVPMAIDFGFPLVKASEDDTQVFSFSLGWTF
jgi:outer membrane protein insertion porin family